MHAPTRDQRISANDISEMPHDRQVRPSNIVTANQSAGLAACTQDMLGSAARPGRLSSINRKLFVQVKLMSLTEHE